MRLLYSQTSPYARKVRIVIELLQLSDMVTLEAVSPWDDTDELKRYNPLMKVPTLVMPNDQALTESNLIIDYLCSVNPETNLLPMTINVWQHVAHMGLADGIMDNTLSIVLETLKRPEAFQYQPWIDRKIKAIEQTLQHLERDSTPEQDANLYEVSLGCALGFLDFRLADVIDWRVIAPRLAAWYETFSEQAFMKTTAPA